MLKQPKTYKIKKTNGKGRETIVEDTLDGLTNYFSYTLEVGNSWNKSVNRKPKTIKSLISNLQKAFEAKEACCYERTSIDLV